MEMQELLPTGERTSGGNFNQLRPRLVNLLISALQVLMQGWPSRCYFLGLLGGWSPLVPVGPLWRCGEPVLPPLVLFISLESRKSLGGCKHSVSVPSVGIFKISHRHWFFNIMGTPFLLSTVYVNASVRMWMQIYESRLLAQTVSLIQASQSKI